MVIIDVDTTHGSNSDMDFRLWSTPTMETDLCICICIVVSSIDVEPRQIISTSHNSQIHTLAVLCVHATGVLL